MIEEEVLKKSRQARYAQDHIRRANDRYDRSMKHAKECDIEDVLWLTCSSEDWMDKARADMVEGLEYGEITLDDLYRFSKRYDAHMLNKRREIADALKKGCGIK